MPTLEGFAHTMSRLLFVSLISMLILLLGSVSLRTLSDIIDAHKVGSVENYEYVFPDGMTPVLLIKGNKPNPPMIFLCETTESIYTECTPEIRPIGNAQP